MRNPLAFATGLTLIASACSSSPGALQEPPVLQVTSPARSLIQSTAGQLTVMGMVSPNAEGTPLQSVTVNGISATLNADGTFSANIALADGAQLIQTVATDAKGDTATDTRSVEAGQQQPVGTMVPTAVAAALSSQVFAKLGGVASTMIQQADLTAMVAPMNPMINVGGSCLGGTGSVDSLTITGAKIGLAPVAGGLALSAEVDGLDVKGHVDFDVACIGGSDTFEVTANAVIVTGTLDMSTGSAGFTSNFTNPNVTINGLNISAGGIPSAVLNLIDFNGLVSFAVSEAAKLFMGPLVNKELGGLTGPHQLTVLGKTMDIQVQPTNANFTTSSGIIGMDMQMQIEGTTGMFTYVADGSPTMDAGSGMQLGLADNLANSLLEQITELNMLNLTMATNGGTFDAAQITATSPPMISAQGSNGKMSLILPDMKVVFMQGTTPVASAALNATLALEIQPSNGGNTIAVTLGTPALDIDTTNDIPNESHFTNDDLSAAVKLGLNAQITSISALLGSIPLPAIDGIQLSNLSVAADSGYVMVKADIQ